MGYFNYFVKCIIRNIAYRLCKPKVFFTILLSLIILFVLHNYGYCEWTDSDLEIIQGSLSTITENQGTMISQLSSLGVNTSTLKTELANIVSKLNAINGNTDNVESSLNTIISDVQTLNTNILNIYNQLDEIQKQLISETFNTSQILSELQQINVLLNGSVVKTLQTYRNSYRALNISNGVTSFSATGNVQNFSVCDYNSSNKYELVFTNTSSSDFLFNVVLSATHPGGNPDVLLLKTVTVPPSSTITYTVSDGFNGYYYLCCSFINNDSLKLYKLSTSSGIVGSLDDIKNNTNLNNQLQEEQNQIQQEQNDFLKQEQSDSDVSVDSFNSVDSNDVTSDGLTGVFTNIYSSITSWNSKDINLPIPYTNKNITIPANYTQQMLSSSGGSWIITFINSIYYFIVARFIIYSITGIINSIKSGSILETDSKNNITTDML